jgi:hypothetical protein
VIEEIVAWVYKAVPKCLPESGLHKAIGYMLNMWPGLVLLLEDPSIPLDNNGTERAARGPVLGRKNHYGSHSLRGTEVAATFYSLVESAKLDDLEPRLYLRAAVRGYDTRPCHSRKRASSIRESLTITPKGSSTPRSLPPRRPHTRDRRTKTLTTKAPKTSSLRKRSLERLRRPIRASSRGCLCAVRERGRRRRR